MTTAGSSPTTQASCPLGSDVTSPGPAVLVQGQEEGTLKFTGSASQAARMTVSALEGAMLVSRPYGDITRFQATADRLFAGLASPSSAELTRSR